MGNENNVAVRDLPCAYYSMRKRRLEKPVVDCRSDCNYCGWNPKEIQRRITEGGWKTDKKGVRYLSFPPRKRDEGADQK